MKRQDVSDTGMDGQSVSLTVKPVLASGTGVLTRLWEGLVGRSPEGTVPLRVRVALEEEQRKGEILVGWVQAVILATWAVLYAVSPKAFSSEVSFHPVPWTLTVYACFLGVRVWLAHIRRLSPWLLSASIVADMAALMVLIWSFHLQYGQPPAFYLKAPTLLYVFIFISLRTLRFEAKWILIAGSAGAVGWLILLAIAINDEGSITRNYIEYMTSSSVLLGAEIDKVISITIVSLVLAVAVQRARRLMERAAIDHVAASDLSRFVASGVAKTISTANSAIQPGQAEIRSAAALFIDMRGFTALTRALPPTDLMLLLGEYQRCVLPIVQRHGGQIDKFLGDGIFATFGTVRSSTTFATDALTTADEIVKELNAWTDERRRKGLFVVDVSLAVASGEVLFGVVGDDTRMEYTVIGDPVNVAAKLEKHTRVEAVTSLTDMSTYELALQQGYSPTVEPDIRLARQVGGVAHPIDIVVLAR